MAQSATPGEAPDRLRNIMLRNTTQMDVYNSQIRTTGEQLAKLVEELRKKVSDE